MQNLLFQITLTIKKMVNATCDFCSNTYRKKKTDVGYFKLSPALRVSLCIKKGTDLNSICGEHFSDSDLSSYGRLIPGAKPKIFYRLCTSAHDHPYSSHISEQQEYGGIGTSLLGCPKIKYCQAQFQLASSVPVNLN